MKNLSLLLFQERDEWLSLITIPKEFQTLISIFNFKSM